MSTFAGSGLIGAASGTGSSASFNYPMRVCKGNDAIYVVESQGDTIRKITMKGEVSLYAGEYNFASYVNGPLLSAKFSMPTGCAADAFGNLYICKHDIMATNNQLIVTTIAFDLST